MQRVLITGGAGFIGSHLADELLAHGYRVRVLDTLAAQVHSEGKRRPSYLHPDVEVQVADVCDSPSLARALEGIDAVFHFAAAVGVGQSMYEIAHYTRVNNLGTAVLLEALVAHPVQRLVLASSMSLYGEGLYRNARGDIVEAGERSLEQLRCGEWERRTSNRRSSASTAWATSGIALPTFPRRSTCWATSRRSHSVTAWRNSLHGWQAKPRWTAWRRPAPNSAHAH